MKCFGIATPAIVTIVQYVEKETAESVICSTYDSPYNSGCIHCDNDHWI